MLHFRAYIRVGQRGRFIPPLRLRPNPEFLGFFAGPPERPFFPYLASEAQKISDRTKAGMARAKAKGIKIGRPRLGIELRQKIAQRAAKGETPYAIAKALGVDRHTVAKYAV